MKISRLTRMSLLIPLAVMGLYGSAVARDDQASDSTRENAIRESVVKISATLRDPDILHPWTKAEPTLGKRYGSHH